MTTPQDDPQVTAESLREWGHHVESVLRGLAHALNNRAAALSAVIELSSEPDDDPAATRQILVEEMSRVQDLVKVVRAVGVPRPGSEAIAPGDLAPEIQSVLALHADLKDRTVRIDGSAAPAVRVPRWMLARALVSLAASAVPPAGERSVTLTIGEDGDWMVARVPGGRSGYANELAAAMGGEPLADASGFRIPTLEAIRRREAR